MKASDFMTPDPVVIPSSSEIHKAAELMETHLIRHLPVVDEGDLVGVLSERNILEASGWAFPATGRRMSSVRESMHIPVETTSPDENASAVCARLVEWRIGCLPVVDGKNLVGIVTDVDVMRAYAKAMDGASEAAQDPPVGERMTRGVVTIEHDTPVEQAIELMRGERVRHLPVVEDGRAVGMISDRDIRLCLGRGLPISIPSSTFATPDVTTIAPDRPLSEAAEIMLLQKIGALVVVEDDRLAGVLSSMDILEHCAAMDWTAL